VTGTNEGTYARIQSTDIIERQDKSMDYRRFGNDVVIRIDRYEEVMEKLEEVCKKEGILLGSISGLGAASYVEMGLYDVEQKAFTGTVLEQPLEVTSLIGSVTEMDGKPYLHVHIGAADVTGKAYGGHLKKCVIGGTAEIFIHAAEGHVGRRPDWFSDTGLNLYDFE